MNHLAFSPHVHGFSSRFLPGGGRARPVGRVCASVKMSSATRDTDLLIVGAGCLGRRIAAQWLHLHPNANVTGETRTSQRHEELRNLGINPALVGEASNQHYSNVVFCAPPSGSSDYPASARSAVERTDQNGVVVFTSSVAVYRKDQNVLNENSPVVLTERSKPLLEAEQVVLAHKGGRVIRVAGLYTIDRGPHSFFLRKGHNAAHPQGVLNLISYDDAASFVIACLKYRASERGEASDGRRIFIGADGSPTTREEICTCALSNPFYNSASMPTFDKSVPMQTTTYDNSLSREMLQWAPKYPSFSAYMENASVENTS